MNAERAEAIHDAERRLRKAIEDLRDLGIGAEQLVLGARHFAEDYEREDEPDDDDRPEPADHLVAREQGKAYDDGS